MNNLETLQQNASQEYAAATGETAKQIWSTIINIIDYLKNMNTIDPATALENDKLKKENDALKKENTALTNLINYESSNLQQFSDALKLSDSDLTVPQKIQKARDLMTELETLRFKK